MSNKCMWEWEIEGAAVHWIYLKLGVHTWLQLRTLGTSMCTIASISIKND